MNQNSSRSESRFPSKWIHHSYSHIIKQSKQINEWKMPLLPISHSLFYLYKHYLICYSSIIGFIFHDIHATTKTKEYHIFFILSNNNRCNTSWKLPLVQHSHFQIHQCPNTQQDRKEPTSMRSKIHLHAKLSPHHCTHISESNNHSTIVDVLH